MLIALVELYSVVNLSHIYGEMTEYQALEKSSGKSKDVLGVHTEPLDQGSCVGFHTTMIWSVF